MIKVFGDISSATGRSGVLGCIVFLTSLSHGSPVAAAGGRIEPTVIPQTAVTTLRSGTADTFPFSVSRPGVYRFSFCAPLGSATFDTLLELRNASGEVIVQSDDECVLLSEIAQALEPGEYSVVVGDPNGNGGAYEMGYVIDVDCAGRSLEPAVAIRPGPGVNFVEGRVGSQMANAHAFAAYSPGAYTFSFCHPEARAQYDAVLCVYSMDGDLRASDDDTCGNNPAVSVDLPAGRYAVVVSGFGAASGDYTLAVTVDPQSDFFRRGDPSGQGDVNIASAVFLLEFLFAGGRAPTCLDAADADDNSELQITDPIFILEFLFSGGSTPPFPGPWDCHEDPTADGFPDCVYTAC